MKVPAEKSPDNQRQAAAHEAPQQQVGAEAEYEFVDNREETASLRQLQKTLDNRPWSPGLAQLTARMNISPRGAENMSLDSSPQPQSKASTLYGIVDNRPETASLRKMQEKINNSPRRQEMAQLKAKMNSSPRRDAMRSLQAKVGNSPRRASLRLQAGMSDVLVQRVEDEDVLQGEFAVEAPAQLAQPPEEKPNNTGLPDNLKAGVESLSGMSLDNVKVHYNSSEPAQLNAYVYAQGRDIHLGSGQEQHLPHEAWHVVQQAQGRVKPTVQMNDGMGVNDDLGLEAEGDSMGLRPLQSHSNTRIYGKAEKSTSSIVLQAMFRVTTGKTTKIDPQNEAILKDALEALLKVQEDTVTTIGSFAEKVSTLADYVGKNGYDLVAQAELKTLYKTLSDVSFKSNPVLNESWKRCIASTRSAAAKSLYSKVGGKFHRKFGEVLNEIATHYPNLAPTVNLLLTCDVNKEHLINKALGGPQTEEKNLMDAGVGEKHFGGSGTLSELHKEFHRLKSGGNTYDFSTVVVEFETIVQDIQDDYDSDDMGKLSY